jgi:acyl-CoA thioesterase FadM
MTVDLEQAGYAGCFVRETTGATATAYLRPRWDDCDANGHVNNAAYLAILRTALDQSVGPLALEGWLDGARLQEADLEYHEPIRVDDELAVVLRVKEASASALTLLSSFEVGGRHRAEATVRWTRAAGEEPEAFPKPIRDVAGLPFVVHQQVRSYEVGPDETARPQAVLQWLEHAVFRAAESAGWDRVRMRASDFVTVQVGHRLRLGLPADAGEVVRIESRLIDLRRVSGVWHHEVRRADGAMVAIDRSRGAFLDRAGHVHAAPAELLAALLRGEGSAR